MFNEMLIIITCHIYMCIFFKRMSLMPIIVSHKLFYEDVKTTFVYIWGSFQNINKNLKVKKKNLCFVRRIQVKE